MSPMIASEPGHDDGLQHEHDWARGGPEPTRRIDALVADPAAVTTPSSVLHDDAHYTA